MKRALARAALSGTLLILAACAATPPPPAAPPPAGPAFSQTGKASWYGPRFHGRKTANGERFDQNALTAAHRTLPLGSIVTVRNVENGRTVRVRINDRGPYVEGRVIDLSREAARRLGLVQDGVASVRIEATTEGLAGIDEGAVASRDGGAQPASGS